MSELEERLRRGLAAEAEAHDVDVEALRHRTRERLAGVASRRTSPAASRSLQVLAAAASVAAIAGLTNAFWPGSDDRSQLARDDRSGDVDASFACPARMQVDVTSGSQDEFLPDVEKLGSPAAVAREYDAARWAFDVAGDSATLRLANTDGTLGSITTYRATDDGWAMESAEVCVGAGGSAAAPTTDELRLGTHGGEPWPSSFEKRYYPAMSVLVDDRSVYDYSGLITRHSSMYVTPCERDRLCWHTGKLDSYVTGSLPGEPGPRIRDVTGLLYLPDDMVDRTSSLGMWAVYDRDDAVASLVVRLRDGTELTAQTFTDPSWDGAVLHAVLAPRADVESIVMTQRGGQVVEVAPESIG